MAHAPELHSQVRALAWRLSSGEISWADYRERRAKIVNAILNGEQTLEYKKPVVNEDATTPKHHDTEQVFIDVDAMERPPSRMPAYIAVGVLVAVLLGVGWILIQSAEPPVVASAPEMNLGPGEALLDEFVRGGEWSTQTVSTLTQDWQQLSAEAKEATKSSALWRRLQSQLRDQINQQRILMSVDETGEAQALLEHLQALQRALNAT